MRALALGCVLLASATALAQPMMMDPSRMSGIPRPDPQVPAGTVTVRLIRGELSNRMVGVAVELSDANGKVTTQKTDGEGRATFAGLTGGASYQARAKEGDEELTSQQIDLPSDMGVRVMLVFKPGAGAGGGGGDGVARSEKDVPPGTVIVKAVGEGGTGAAGVDVTLGMARQGESGVKEYHAKTNGDGEAKFSGLDAKPNSGYLAQIVIDNVRYTSKPFRLTDNAGSRVAIDVRPVSKDVAVLKVSAAHFILEPIDDAVQVIELLRITNPTKAAVDPGSTGLHLPLPDKSLQAQAGPQNPPGLKVSGHDVILPGPIPPGDTELQVIYAMAYDGADLEFSQHAPIAYDDLAIVHEKIDGGMRIEADGLSHDDRPMQGGKVVVLYHGVNTPAGGTIHFTMRNLPHSDATWRILAAALAVLLLLGFGVYAATAKSVRPNVERLEAEREKLLGQLAALEQKSGDDEKRARKKEQLVAQLTRVYRDLDEAR